VRQHATTRRGQPTNGDCAESDSRSIRGHSATGRGPKKNDLDGELELLAIELAVGVLVDQPEDRFDHLAIPVPA
jgi:hypothetical protein